MFHEKYLLSRHRESPMMNRASGTFSFAQQVSVCEGNKFNEFSTVTRILTVLVKLQQTVLGKSQKNRL